VTADKADVRPDRGRPSTDSANQPWFAIRRWTEWRRLCRSRRCLMSARSTL